MNIISMKIGYVEYLKKKKKCIPILYVRNQIKFIRDFYWAQRKMLYLKIIYLSVRFDSATK